MATISPVITRLDINGQRAFKVLWETVTENDTCAAVELGSHTDRSVQVTGTFGSATAIVQGSNDGTNYVGLNALDDGAAWSNTAAALQGVMEATRYIRPSASGGTGQDLDFTLFIVGGLK